MVIFHSYVSLPEGKTIKPLAARIGCIGGYIEVVAMGVAIGARTTRTGRVHQKGMGMYMSCMEAVYHTIPKMGHEDLI
jgi:hypothetical protein